jgi:CheY-like chemotaxis protein
MSMQGKRVSVLIVEDERIVARDLQQTLNEIGHDAFAIAASGEEAVTIASRRRPDVALMDVRIRGAFDGIQTARALRSLYDVPVIYLTAHADATIMQRADRTGPIGYLLKPVRAAELKSVLDLLLHKIQAEGPIRDKERWFLASLRHVSESVIFVDETLAVTFLNARAEGLLGVPAVRAVTRPVTQLVRLEAVEGASLERALSRALRENDVVGVELATLLGPAGKRELSVRVVPLSDEERVLGAVLILCEPSANLLDQAIGMRV